MYCKHCGKELANQASFCPYCGAHIKIGKGKKTWNKKKTVVITAVTAVVAAAVAVALFLKTETCADMLDALKNIQNNDRKDMAEILTENSAEEQEDLGSVEKVDETEPEVKEEWAAPLLTEDEKELFTTILHMMDFYPDMRSDAEMADNFMMRIYIGGDRGERTALGPVVVETGNGITPVDLSYDQCPEGSEAPYIRCMTKDIEEFLEELYGREFHVPEGELMYAETRNDEGYLYEWGQGWMVSYETGSREYGTPEFIQDGNKLTIRMSYEDYDYVSVTERGIIECEWYYNADSFLNYTLDTETIHIMPQMTAGQIEEERLRIKDTIAAGNTEQYVLQQGTDGIPWKRQLNYENGQLIFAYYFESQTGEEDQRFYFKNGTMIRWVVGTSPDQIFYNLSDEELPDEWEMRESECLSVNVN